MCFDRIENERAFDQSMLALISALLSKARREFIDQNKEQRYNHGVDCVHSAREADPVSNMGTVSACTTIPVDRIANHDLSLISETIIQIKEEMTKQFTQNLFTVVGEAAEKVGNVVDASTAGSFADSMLEALKKIEFGVDRDGKIS